MKGDADARMIALILWCREQGIAWQQLTVGDVTIVGADTRLPAADDKPQPAPRASRATNIREAYGPPPEAIAAADAKTTALVDEP